MMSPAFLGAAEHLLMGRREWTPWSTMLVLVHVQMAFALPHELFVTQPLISGTFTLLIPPSHLGRVSKWLCARLHHNTIRRNKF